ncbi:hypothetical protein HMPREF9296_2519 [Prevotella disiens FB035-09AN]|uniref:Uncharacterized protein n=1 Tax=Prevotella disiens FB035-09AN TaxID=866771 RepID=E1KNY3_9BACT|nr:hypothetical protein [Prevotella disiens]EFL46874.1 hypothetical protein HMPREF9296_2519 [Prevotella disiens FB035-09AN]
MIKEQFLYFAQFPRKEGIAAMFTNGESSFKEYAQLLEALEKLPNKSRIPLIDNYVYGQSFEELQARLDKCFGSYLFVDYGEMQIAADSRNTYQLTQRIAVTIAIKVSDRTDSAERMLASDKTLTILAQLHAILLADADNGNIEWLSRAELDKAEYVPFVATELNSIGWTLMLNAIAPDTLQIHQQYKSFAKNSE